MRTTSNNGCGAFSTTTNSCLDFFTSISSGRNNIENVTQFFEKAFEEDAIIATAILLFSRDIRNGGAGERNLFRKIIPVLVRKNKELASKVCILTPQIGRWDDLKSFYGTSLEKKASTIWADAILMEDVLSSKWAKRSDKVLQKALNFNEMQLRKTLSRIRKAHIPEAKMCSNEWDKIEYDSIPSICGIRSANAFRKHDGERYQEFIDSKETKVNASVAFPYDVYNLYKNGNNKESASKYWENLPNLEIEGSFLPIIDVSGSMSCSATNSLSCMDIAISLGVYLSQQINGKFKNKAITFSEKPTLVSLPETRDISKVFEFTRRMNWGYSTNLEKVYDLILQAAIENNLSQEELPSHLIILSDMQINACTRGSSQDAIFENIKYKFKSAKYKTPKLIFWNLSSTSYNNFPVMDDTPECCMISGFNPAILKAVMKSEVITPIKVMEAAIKPFVEMLK